MSLGYFLKRAANTAFKAEKRFRRGDHAGAGKSLLKLRGDLLEAVARMRVIQEQIAHEAPAPLRQPPREPEA